MILTKVGDTERRSFSEALRSGVGAGETAVPAAGSTTAAQSRVLWALELPRLAMSCPMFDGCKLDDGCAFLTSGVVAGIVVEGALRIAFTTSSSVTSLRHSGGIRSVGTGVDDGPRASRDAIFADFVGDSLLSTARLIGVFARLVGAPVFGVGVPKSTLVGLFLTGLDFFKGLGVRLVGVSVASSFFVDLV